MLSNTRALVLSEPTETLRHHNQQQPVTPPRLVAASPAWVAARESPQHHSRLSARTGSLAEEQIATRWGSGSGTGLAGTSEATYGNRLSQLTRTSSDDSIAGQREAVVTTVARMRQKRRAAATVLDDVRPRLKVQPLEGPLSPSCRARNEGGDVGASPAQPSQQRREEQQTSLRHLALGDDMPSSTAAAERLSALHDELWRLEQMTKRR